MRQACLTQQLLAERDRQRCSPLKDKISNGPLRATANITEFLNNDFVSSQEEKKPLNIFKMSPSDLIKRGRPKVRPDCPEKIDLENPAEVMKRNVLKFLHDGSYENIKHLLKQKQSKFEPVTCQQLNIFI